MVDRLLVRAELGQHLRQRIVCFAQIGVLRQDLTQQRRGFLVFPSRVEQDGQVQLGGIVGVIDLERRAIIGFRPCGIAETHVQVAEVEGRERTVEGTFHPVGEVSQ